MSNIGHHLGGSTEDASDSSLSHTVTMVWRDLEELTKKISNLFMSSNRVSNMNLITPFDFSEPSPDDRARARLQSKTTRRSDHGGDDDFLKRFMDGPVKSKKAKERKRVEPGVNWDPEQSIDEFGRAQATPKQRRLAQARQKSKLKLKELQRHWPSPDLPVHLLLSGASGCGKHSLAGYLLYLQKEIGIRKYHEWDSRLGPCARIKTNRHAVVVSSVRPCRKAQSAKIVTSMASLLLQTDQLLLVSDGKDGPPSGAALQDLIETICIARNFGVSRVLHCITRLDIPRATRWSSARFKSVETATITCILKKCGILPSDVLTLPVSGDTGENVAARQDDYLTKWYQGPTLLDALSDLMPSAQVHRQAFRMLVHSLEVRENTDANEVSTDIVVEGIVISGAVMVGEPILLLDRNGERVEGCTVTSVSILSKPDGSDLISTGCCMSRMHFPQQNWIKPGAVTWKSTTSDIGALGQRCRIEIKASADTAPSNCEFICDETSPCPSLGNAAIRSTKSRSTEENGVSTRVRARLFGLNTLEGQLQLNDFVMLESLVYRDAHEAGSTERGMETTVVAKITKIIGAVSPSSWTVTTKQRPTGLSKGEFLVVELTIISVGSAQSFPIACENMHAPAISFEDRCVWFDTEDSSPCLSRYSFRCCPRIIASDLCALPILYLHPCPRFIYACVGVYLHIWGAWFGDVSLGLHGHTPISSCTFNLMYSLHLCMHIMTSTEPYFSLYQTMPNILGF